MAQTLQLLPLRSCRCNLKLCLGYHSSIQVSNQKSLNRVHCQPRKSEAVTLPLRLGRTYAEGTYSKKLRSSLHTAKAPHSAPTKTMQERPLFSQLHLSTSSCAVRSFGSGAFFLVIDERNCVKLVGFVLEGSAASCTSRVSVLTLLEVNFFENRFMAAKETNLSSSTAFEHFTYPQRQIHW